MLCLLAYENTVTSIWGRQKGVTISLCVLFFPASGHLCTPKHRKTRENAKTTNRPSFTPTAPPRSQNWKATKEYLNQRGTKIRVFQVCFRAPFLPPFFAHFSPSFPSKACSLSHHFSPLHLPLYPPFFDSRTTPI